LSSLLECVVNAVEENYFAAEHHPVAVTVNLGGSPALRRFYCHIMTMDKLFTRARRMCLYRHMV